MNHTPEPQNVLKDALPKPKAVCTWCVSTHVADATCKCEEDCGSGWCGRSEEPPLWL